MQKLVSMSARDLILHLVKDINTFSIIFIWLILTSPVRAAIYPSIVNDQTNYWSLYYNLQRFNVYIAAKIFQNISMNYFLCISLLTYGDSPMNIWLLKVYYLNLLFCL